MTLGTTEGSTGPGVGSTEGSPAEPETFDREYVQALRDEAAGYRQKARGVEELRTRLHAELVRGTGRLADPTDLAFDPAHLDDADALAAALDDLLARKPHLASRRPVGDVGQGAASSDEPFSLLGLLAG